MAPVFHADHIGSLLRPPALLEARSNLSSPSQMYTNTAEESVKDAELKAIKDVVNELIARGIHPITDGEYARHIFYGGFFEKLNGFTVHPNLPIPSAFRTDFPTTTGLAKMGATTRAAVICTGPITYPTNDSPYLPEWLNLRSTLPTHEIANAKLTIPAPSYQHIQLAPGTAYTSSSTYTNDEAYFRALSTCYREEFRTLHAAGLRNIQIDDPHLTYFCSSQFLSGCETDGVNPSALLDLYLKAHDWILEDKPSSLHVGVHLCRGNMSNSTHWASGSYEVIAEKLFQTKFQTFYLEFDDEERAGGFAPLRFLPRGQGKNVVLGLVSTKNPVLEDREMLKRKVFEAADVVAAAWGCGREEALGSLAISPQCGFSSSSLAGGKGMTRERMWEKLELVRDVAEEIWGSKLTK